MRRTVLGLVISLGVVLAGLSLTSCRQQGAETSAEKPQTIVIKGSDTMVHLVSAWAEAYMHDHKNVDISVAGGGSGTGIAALINGTTDIAAASRDIKDKEKQQATAQGRTPVEHAVARDGIVLIVNPNNPVSEMTMTQLKKVYTGAADTWKGVGGPSNPVIVLSRESSSGTYIFFQEHVLEKEDYVKSARLMPATSSIIQTVSEDKWSIGYVGLGYAAEAGNKVKMIQVKADDKTKAIMPSEEAIKSGDYPIARPLFLYTSGEPTGAIKDFIEYTLSDAGQQIVKETGYVSVN